MSDNPLDPGPETERKIRDRAYHLWESEGRPQGRDADYWERARELQAMADSVGAGELPNPMNDTRPFLTEQPVEEAKLQENLGEFPHGGLRDQGDRQETPAVPVKGRDNSKRADMQAGGGDSGKGRKKG